MGWQGVQSRQRLAGQLRRLTLFASCGRQELSYLTKWADVVAVPAGQELVREGSGGFWMFVLLEGRVGLAAAGRALGELAPGEELGHESLVGFRPHPFTATAQTACILLVLRPRFALSLLTMGGGIQRHLYPSCAPGEFGSYFEQMLEQGRREWSDLQGRAGRRPLSRPSTPGPPPVARPTAVGRTAATATLTRPATAPPSARSGLRSTALVQGAQGDGVPALHRLSSERLAGRRLSLAEAASVVARIPVADSADDAPAATTLGPPWLSRVLGWVALTAAVAVGALVLGLYHPPRYAVTAGRPIDVAGDVSISGATVHPIRGHLLLLWVRARQPDLAGLLWDFVTGTATVGIDPTSESASDRTSAYAAGRQEYLQSQQVAIGVAEAAAGVNPGRVQVRIVDRGFVGPSAGLVYGLAVYDLLSGAGPPAGAVVAATGALSPDGALAPVGWVSLKAGAASDGRAQVLLVPSAESGSLHRPGLRVRPIDSFGQATVRQDWP